MSFADFYLPVKSVGLRASELKEIEGLDCSEYGMYAYPPSFRADGVGAPRWAVR